MAIPIYTDKILSISLPTSEKTDSTEMDWEKINKIKEQLASGSYTIDNQQLAEKLLDFEQNLIYFTQINNKEV